MSRRDLQMLVAHVLLLLFIIITIISILQVLVMWGLCVLGWVSVLVLLTSACIFRVLITTLLWRDSNRKGKQKREQSLLLAAGGAA
jgi:hypothetical protein